MLMKGSLHFVVKASQIGTEINNNGSLLLCIRLSSTIETAGHVSPVLLLFINARCIKSFLTWRVYPKSTNLLPKALLVNFIFIFNIIHEKCGNAALYILYTAEHGCHVQRELSEHHENVATLMVARFTARLLLLVSQNHDQL